MSNMVEVNFHLQNYKPDVSVPTIINIENIIKGLENNDKPLYEQALINFLVKEYQEFNIESLTDEKREDLWKALIKLMKESDDNDVLAVVFTVFRIISRNKNSVDKLVTKEWLDLLMQHTGLNDTKFHYSDDTLCKIEEGQKVLWNILYNSTQQVAATIDNGLLEKLFNRIRLYEEIHVPDIIKFYDVKFIFYLSAISKIVREKVIESNGLLLLIKVLIILLKEASAGSASESLNQPVCLNDVKTDTASETLKALFNITVDAAEGDNDTLLKEYQELMRILRSYLLVSTVTLEKTWSLRNNIVNLLYNIPGSFYIELIPHVNESVSLPKSLKFENYDMIVIHEILMFLEAKFKDQNTVGRQMEVFSPILSVLLKGANSHRSIRKYLRIQILPPLKEMEKRPEETDTLRGHLCKFLTTPITEIRDLVAELLFVLCKCNVARMIKYTGFGNAAGLLAQKGLLNGKKDLAEEDYSSNSGESDTEEYLDKLHLVNPVLGCIGNPHENSMKGMSDEQKEYEAMKLVQHIDNLSKTGVIKPCRIGPDGKPCPIEHILEFEGLKLRKSNPSDDEADSE